jgi:D-glycero-D-manno-heptose 1,7-bisphosphate phosphatase
MAEVSRAAAFLDRDGTLIEEAHYLAHPEQVRLIPGAAAAVRALNALRIPVVVVTNQSGVAHGYFTEAQVAAVHARVGELLGAEDARVDRYYHCPHHPAGKDPRYRTACACRKPEPGMLLQAAGELGIDLTTSCMIGDKLCDVQAGTRAGCVPFLVRTGHGAAAVRGAGPEELTGVAVVDALPSAVDAWLRQTGRAVSS